MKALATDARLEGHTGVPFGDRAAEMLARNIERTLFFLGARCHVTETGRCTTRRKSERYERGRSERSDEGPPTLMDYATIFSRDRKPD